MQSASPSLLLGQVAEQANATTSGESSARLLNVSSCTFVLLHAIKSGELRGAGIAGDKLSVVRREGEFGRAPSLSSVQTSTATAVFVSL